MLKDTPCSHWPMGRVLEIHRGSNDVVSVRKLKMTSRQVIISAPKVTLLETKLH